jgi:polygalacturonase
MSFGKRSAKEWLFKHNLLLWPAAVIVWWTLVEPTAGQAVYNVMSYGATGNGVALDTSSIQAAVTAARNGGGGQVFFPPGIYKTTTITITNNVTLNLTNGAFLVASTNQSDWTKSGQIVYALSSHDVGIIGSGVVDGGGLVYYVGGPTNASEASGHHTVHTIQFQNCSNVVVSGIHVQNSTEQTLVFDQCDYVTVDSVTVTNRAREYGSGTDGIDLNNCRYVTVNNMNIETGDDGICVKTQGDAYQNPPRRTAHDIVVKNCTVASTTQATKIGTATSDEVYNLTFTNITINRHAHVTTTNNPIPTGECEAAIALGMNDGGTNHDIVCTHYWIAHCDIPIYLEIQNRTNAFGGEYDITVSDIACANALAASQFNVQLGGQFQNITLSNITVHNFETNSTTASPPYQDGSYPYGYKIGNTLLHMPAYGLFARYVNGLHLKGNMTFYDDGHSGRPAMAFENCSNVTTNPATAGSGPSPYIGGIGLGMNGSQVVLQGANGPASKNYYVLTSTNLGSALTNWAVIGSNTFGLDGGFTFTNATGSGFPQQRFYILKVP